MVSTLGSALAGLFIFPTTGNPDCPGAWAVNAARAGKTIQIQVREQGQMGPACDLTVRGFEYDETLGLVALSVQPARVCPVDALAERKADFYWNLPQELREKADLIVAVNGVLWGALHLNKDQVTTEGVCP